MIKIYATKAKELAVLEFLAEFKVSAFTNYPIKGRTRKVRGHFKQRLGLYKVTNYPI